MFTHVNHIFSRSLCTITEVHGIRKDLRLGHHARSVEATHNRRGRKILLGLSCKDHVPRYIHLKKLVFVICNSISWLYLVYGYCAIIFTVQNFKQQLKYLALPYKHNHYSQCASFCHTVYGAHLVSAIVWFCNGPYETATHKGSNRR